MNRSNTTKWSARPCDRPVDPAWLFAGLAGIAGAAWAVWAGGHAPSRRPVAERPTIARAPYDPHRTRQLVAFFAQRVREDRKDWLSLSVLSGHYLELCRETGDIGDAVRGEASARQSLALFSRANDAARSQLAMSLLTQHRFSEALTEITPTLRPGMKAPPETSPQARLLRAEIAIEMGDYDAAAGAMAALGHEQTGPNGCALRARMLEINGQPERALDAMLHAARLADAGIDMPPASAAWYHMRIGNILADLGRADDAQRAYQDALAIFPQDYRTLTSLTRLAAGRADWQSALAWGKRSAAIVPTPEVVALIGDAYSALGMSREAGEQYALVDTIAELARAQGSIYDRQQALFCADHNRNLDAALALARRELRIRHDIYAYDTLAWVCCRKGLLSEAHTAMARAIARGTHDARLYYHAGNLALAQGDTALAKADLYKALRMNPYFLPFAPQRARRLLAQLARN